MNIGAFLSAALFGLGLSISQMTNPAKVIAFLDVFGNWDPSLIFVMIGAIVVHAATYRLVTKRKSPLFATEFRIPSLKQIDRNLIFGAFIFGIGWGLGGICPGPAFVVLVKGYVSVTVFMISMIAGIYLYSFLQKSKGS